MHQWTVEHSRDRSATSATSPTFEETLPPTSRPLRAVLRRSRLRAPPDSFGFPDAHRPNGDAGLPSRYPERGRAGRGIACRSCHLSFIAGCADDNVARCSSWCVTAKRMPTPGVSSSDGRIRRCRPRGANRQRRWRRCCLPRAGWWRARYAGRPRRLRRSDVGSSSTTRGSSSTTERSMANPSAKFPLTPGDGGERISRSHRREESPS